MPMLKKGFAPLFVAFLVAGCGSEKDDSSTAVQAVMIPASGLAPTGSNTLPPPPTTTTTSPAGLQGDTPIASNFDVSSQLVLAGGSGVIPKSAAPDVVGAFRFICLPGQISYNDPIVFPGQPGRSHLHQFFGNTKADAHSTYKTLREAGESTCMSPLNRSAYWMPAMLDGAGSVVRPDYVTIYYKRRPLKDPKCSLSSGDPKAEGNCVALPNGLKFVFGWDPTKSTTTKTGGGYYTCDGEGARAGKYKTLTEALPNCPVGSRLGAVINAPSCWDGKTLDSANHRSHVSFPSYGSWGYLKCPSTHPYVIPTFTMGAWFKVDANMKNWKLSSDAMLPGAAPGSTFHADFFMAWDPTVKKLWHDNCIDKLLNCSAGELGNGQQIRQAWPFAWSANPRLVPVPTS